MIEGCCDPGRARNLVEWFFNKTKHCRRVATRYDKFAANYLANREARTGQSRLRRSVPDA